MITVEWLDGHREEGDPPDPNFPDGVDVNLAGDWGCIIQLRPYPAPRCGWFVVKCDICGANAVIITKGRSDDPRAVRLACKGRKLI